MFDDFFGIQAPLSFFSTFFNKYTYTFFTFLTNISTRNQKKQLLYVMPAFIVYFKFYKIKVENSRKKQKYLEIRNL